MENQQEETVAVGATFKQETVVKLLRQYFQDGKTRIHNDAASLTVELLHIFAEEGARRAAKRAQNEGSEEVTIEHFEKILPQLLLDF